MRVPVPNGPAVAAWGVCAWVCAWVGVWVCVAILQEIELHREGITALAVRARPRI